MDFKHWHINWLTPKLKPEKTAIKGITGFKRMHRFDFEKDDFWFFEKFFFSNGRKKSFCWSYDTSNISLQCFNLFDIDLRWFELRLGMVFFTWKVLSVPLGIFLCTQLPQFTSLHSKEDGRRRRWRMDMGTTKQHAQKRDGAICHPRDRSATQHAENTERGEKENKWAIREQCLPIISCVCQRLIVCVYVARVMCVVCAHSWLVSLTHAFCSTHVRSAEVECCSHWPMKSGE